MEVRAWLLLGGWVASVACVATSSAGPPEFARVEIRSFHSDVGERCTTADIPLSDEQAHIFFSRSRAVTSRTVHDDYDLLPCYLVGVMQFRGKPARWQLHLGGVAIIVQGQRTRYFVCDDCESMFERK